MDNDTAPPLPGDLLLITQLELVTPTTVAGVFYGIAFTLYCLYIHALVPRFRNGDRIRQAKFMIAYSTVIMICGLLALIINTWVVQDAYIKHSDYPGSPYFYELSSYFTTPVIAIGFACQVVIDIMTLAIQIWRVWIVWSATQYSTPVTILPGLCFLTFTGLRLRSTVLALTLPVAEVLSQDAIIQHVEYAVQGATTILCTILISLCLIFKQWQQRKLIGESQGSTGYVSIVAMIVESYALESIWLLATIILWNPPAGAFFIESLIYIEIISYFLLQYRVARGKAYESQRGQRNVSSLRWNHSNHATTQFGEADGEVHDGPHVPELPEVPRILQVSRMA